MTATEEAAAKAWECMFAHAMPAAIGLDFVQERTDDRDKALEAMIVEICTFIGNRRPSTREPVGSFPDVEAGALAGSLVSGGCDFAVTILKNMKARLYRQEPNPTSSMPLISAWIEWCGIADKAIRLCRELVAAAKPPGERT